MLRISREVIPKMFKINSFAARHELERGFAVKVKVPQVSQQPHRLPIANAWKKGVHQPDIMTNHNLFTKTQRDCESVNILRHRFLGITVKRFCRLTESAQVGRDN